MSVRSRTDARRLREGRQRQEAGRDSLEQTDDDTRGGLAFSLIEMRSEILTQIDRALPAARVSRGGRR